jgi:damage-control phosphatase, subfamily I
MFFDPGCIPCIIKQAHNSAKLFSRGDSDKELAVIKKVCIEAGNLNNGYTAPLFAARMQEIVEEYFNLSNPYAKIKNENYSKALQYIPYLNTMLESSNDKLEIAVRAAITGNIIDFAANPNFDIEGEINKITSNNIVLSELDRFRKDIYNANLILYIADNYEEALFDKILLKQLPKDKTIYAVRSKPVLNDITMEDAKRIGIDKLCRVIESGSTIAGTDLSQATEEFFQIYKNADVVIAKGQGNYETLLDQNRPIYFLFKVKCDVIAKRCGYPYGKGILLFNEKNIEEKNEAI